MSNYTEIVHSSYRSDGRDTVASKPTGFIQPEAFTTEAPAPSDPKYEMWTEDHSVQSRARRENRENRVKPPPVADVPDFDLDTHLREAQKEKSKEKSKWKFW